MQGQVVDTPVAREFMGEVLARVQPEGLRSIADAAAAKSAAFRRLLRNGAGPLDRPALRSLLRTTFVARRQADAVLDAVGVEELRAGIDGLLASERELGARLEAIVPLLDAFPQLQADLPFELLRFTDPDHFWPWTRWMWDPRSETGALRLLVTDDVELTGSDRVETYFHVGRAVAFVDETARAAGLGEIGDGPFAIDVLLACVYGVYMYTVLRLRMSQEFNRIVPELPELVRRLLGVHQPEVQ